MRTELEQDTPIYFEVSGKLDAIYTRLDHEKITHWLMRFKDGVDIDDCRGGRITTGGDMKFEGSPRDVYWSSMNPCLHDVVDDVVAFVERRAKEYPQEIGMRAFNEAEQLLKMFVGKVYKRMVDIDRSLRGSGNPRSVEPYNASNHIEGMGRLITSRVSSVRAAYERSQPKGLLAIIERHPATASLVSGAGGTIIGAILGAALTKALG